MEAVMIVVMLLLLLCAFALVAGAGLLEALNDLWRDDMKQMKMYWWFVMGNSWAGRDIDWFEGTRNLEAAARHRWNQKYPWTGDFIHSVSIAERMALIAGSMIGVKALYGILVWGDVGALWYVVIPFGWFVAVWGLWGGVSMYGYHYLFPKRSKGSFWHFAKHALMFWRDDLSWTGE